MVTNQGPTNNDVGMSTESGVLIWWNYDPSAGHGQLDVVVGEGATVFRLSRDEAYRMCDMITGSIDYREGYYG